MTAGNRWIETPDGLAKCPRCEVERLALALREAFPTALTEYTQRELQGKAEFLLSEMTSRSER